MDIIQVSGTWGLGSIPGEGMILQQVGSAGKEGNVVDHSPDQPFDLFSTLLTILVCAIWGGAFVAIKIGLLDMLLLGSAALRFFVTSLLLFALARSQHVTFSCTR